MDPVNETPQVEVDVQEIVNILTQRIAHLELNNAAQQAHIAALLARLVAEATERGEMSDKAEQDVPDNVVSSPPEEEAEGIPPEQE